MGMLIGHLLIVSIPSYLSTVFPFQFPSAVSSLFDVFQYMVAELSYLGWTLRSQISGSSTCVSTMVSPYFHVARTAVVMSVIVLVKVLSFTFTVNI